MNKEGKAARVDGTPTTSLRPNTSLRDTVEMPSSEGRAVSKPLDPAPVATGSRRRIQNAVRADASNLAAVPRRKTSALQAAPVGRMRVASAAAKLRRKNPRRVRILQALLERPRSREELDRIAGASNVPDIMMRMRRELGLDFECEHVDAVDRDGRACRPGIYSLTEVGRACALEYLCEVD